MHLKSLTVRGFKSFASATTFEFEPGITAVVGPNGSGKSNVVDALAWVMGEQGAKTLRGGKMEDVIFAGTSSRPALGRAQVSLTIDNADGALPIEYAEVTIARTLFRAGGSEYAINGSACRLLDIQELLSDSGLGKEMHVIVGQGQLDRVLHATAEDRRGFIEEAAGILKHRRRKEKTLRKLEGMAANLARLSDLTGEIARQLTPLGKQAAVARRAQAVQFDVRDARARLLADELTTLRDAVARDGAADQVRTARKEQAAAALAEAQTRVTALEQAAAAAAPQLTAATDTWYQLSGQREQLTALQLVAAERHRHVGQGDPAPDPSRDPERLAQQAAHLRASERQLTADVATHRQALSDATTQRGTAEAAVQAEEQRRRAALRAAADQRETLARQAGQVAAARSTVEATRAEIGRLHASHAAAAERHRVAAGDFAALEAQVAGAEDGEAQLDAAYEQAAAHVAALDERITALTATQLAADRTREALTARREALAVGLRRQDGSAALLAHGLDGVHGPLASRLTVHPGHEVAVAAALGAAADGVAVADAAAALTALARLQADDGGRVTLVLAAPGAGTLDAALDVTLAHTVAEALAAVPGSLAATAVVDVAADFAPTVHTLLAGVVLVPDAATAAALVARFPTLTAVTSAGDVLSAAVVHGGSATAPSLLELQAAVDATDAQLGEATAAGERARFALVAAQAEREPAAVAATAALAALHDSDARLAAVSERLGALGATLRSATGESARHTAALAAATATLHREETVLAAATERLAATQAATATPAPGGGLASGVDGAPAADGERSRAADAAAEEAEEAAADRATDALARAAAQARTAEVDARLTLRSTEEQLAAVGQRAGALERTADTERAARERAATRAQQRRRQAAQAVAVGQAAAQLLTLLDGSLRQAEQARTAAATQRDAVEQELVTLRATSTTLSAELATLTASVHRDELARAAQHARREALETKAQDELGLSAEALLADFGPTLPVPPSPGADGELGVPFVRAEQETRLRRAEKDLAALGKVNPLALEEFDALEERHLFLSTQLADLKASRKDLLAIIKEVDQRVEEVFTAAYTETAIQFEQVFARLFPGGEGRLVLTNPDDMLTTGIEVEARPAGKRIKRLSLLSGGERSLTAVALLVAIFKARPSPFYVMDEVEAALDDTNLGRLITLFEELRESSQLIIITHQKRTMEVADALYGVSMRGDGVSQVIGQRMNREFGQD